MPAWRRDGRPCLLAHRGHRAAGPENSLRSVVAAFHAADGAEVDVVVCADGTPVLRHDDRLDGGAPVRSLSLAELRAVDRAGADDLPTFVEVLDALGDRLSTGLLNVELKVPGAARALEPCRDRLVGGRGGLGILFTSFFVAEVLEARARFPRAEVGLLSERAPIPFVPAGIDLLAVHHDVAAAVRAAHPEARLVVWTVNDEGAAARARAAGCDAWIGDDVEALARWAAG